MPIVLDQNTLFLSNPFKGWCGTYSGSQGNLDPLTTATYQNTVKLGGYDTTNPVTLGFSTYFKLQGYNTQTSQYEVWHSKDMPLLTPPSGNVLVNIEVIATWTDR